MIEIYQGETANIEISVVDSGGEAVSLGGASAKFYYRDLGSSEIVEKDCAIDGSVLSVRFESVETAEMIGSYEYEVKVRDYSGDIDMVLSGRINVKESIAPNGLM